MFYGDIVVAAIYAMQMMICVLFALPYKRGNKHIFLLAIITLIEYYIVKLTTLNIDIYWLAYVVEFFGTLLVIAIFNSGNIWRNFMISWFNFQTANIFIIIEGAIASYFVDINSIIIFGASGNDKYVFVEIILMLGNALIALWISRKIFKFEYKNDGKIYKYIVAVIVIVGTVLGLKKNYMIAEVREGSKLGVYKIYVVAIAIIIIVMYLVGYIYNVSETKRLLREREELKKIIKSNYAQYKTVINTNKNLEGVKEELKELKCVTDINVSTRTLSGNLTLDTLVSNYYNIAQNQNITLEIYIEPLKSDIERDMKLATIIDDLMKQAIKACMECNDTRWIYVRIIHHRNNQLIKIEYSKPVGYKVKPKDFKLTYSIVSLGNGVIDLSDKFNEVDVSILL